MFTERERQIIERFERYGREGRTSTHPVWADDLTRSIFRNFPPDGAFVDVGCGEGRFTAVLDDLGIGRGGYLGIDPSPAQVRLASKLHPECAFEVGNIYELGNKYPGRFDGFFCTAVLMILPRERLPAALVSLRASLKKKAVGFISTPLGKGEMKSVDGLTVTLYETDELGDAFLQAGFVAHLCRHDGGMILGAIQAV